VGKSPLQRAGCGCITMSPLPWGSHSFRAGARGRGGTAARAAVWAVLGTPSCVRRWGLCAGCVLGAASQVPHVSTGDLPPATTPPATTTTAPRAPPRNVGTGRALLQPPALPGAAATGRPSSHLSRGEGRVPPAPALVSKAASGRGTSP